MVSICDRAGIPVDRTISMRCICTWNPPESPLQTDVQKARLVVRGDTDLALTSVQSEAPTIALGWVAKLRCTLVRLIAGICTRDVKTAFLQGGKEAESTRNIHCEPSSENRTKLGLVDSQILKVEGSVYALRTAPRNGWKGLKSSILSHCWRGHQLDQCLYLLCDGQELLGIVGIHVDDCLICRNERHPRFQQAQDESRKSFKWRTKNKPNHHVQHQAPYHSRHQHLSPA